MSLAGWKGASNIMSTHKGDQCLSRPPQSEDGEWGNQQASQPRPSEHHKPVTMEREQQGRPRSQLTQQIGACLQTGMNCNYRSCSGSSYRAERYHQVHSRLSHLHLQVSVGFCIVVAKVRIVDREAGSFCCCHYHSCRPHST